MSWLPELHYSEQAMQTIRESVRIKAEASRPLLPLSKRESEVLPWLIVGKTDRDIGQILSISPKTVNVHVECIKRKYNVTNHVALAYDVALQASSGSVVLKSGGDDLPTSPKSSALVVGSATDASSPASVGSPPGILRGLRELVDKQCGRAQVNSASLRKPTKLILHEEVDPCCW